MPLDIRGVCPLLQVFDMPTSLRFYRDQLGFEVISSSGSGDDCGWALLRQNGATLMLNTAYEREFRPAAPDPVRLAAHDDTALFFDCGDVDAAYAYLRSLGLNVQEPVTREYGMRQLSIADPDGFSLCFQAPVG